MKICKLRYIFSCTDYKSTEFTYTESSPVLHSHKYLLPWSHMSYFSPYYNNSSHLNKTHVKFHSTIKVQYGLVEQADKY